MEMFLLKILVSLEDLSHLENSNSWVQLWLNLALTVIEASSVVILSHDTK